jgi:hypothetical protein
MRGKGRFGGGFEFLLVDMKAFQCIQGFEYVPQ